MNRRILLIVVTLAIAIPIGGITYAGGMGGGMTGGMGGFMGGGSGMMGHSPMMSNPWSSHSQNPDPAYQNKNRKTDRLRKEIREKRRELADLYRSEKPDKDLIDQKIKELSRIEAELDRKWSSR